MIHEVGETSGGRPVPTVRVFAGTGTGPTALAAFDRALQVGGVQDTNLVVLSSVVPAGSRVVRATANPAEFRAGDRLFCVLAEGRVVKPGTETWAGLGWAVDDHGKGGLFVEAHGHSEHQVRYELAATLEALIADRPYWTIGTWETEVVGISCDGEPVCALVMAIYEDQAWAAQGR